MSDDDWFELFTCFVIACAITAVAAMLITIVACFPYFFGFLIYIAIATLIVWNFRSDIYDGPGAC